MNAQELARVIDHTLLKPEASAAAIEELCSQAKEYNFRISVFFFDDFLYAFITLNQNVNFSFNSSLWQLTFNILLQIKRLGLIYQV